MRNQTEQKVFTFIQEHKMIAPGENVVAGVSGGADSVCLLLLLNRWMRRFGGNLFVVHVNHRIRKEAGEDAAYVRKLCLERGIPFFLQEEDVPKRAEEEKRSEEEMGRIVRYETFDRIAHEVHAQKIAVAHNQNDLAETMLFHLFRGTGLAGMCGIRPVLGNVIRPLLCLEREEIEDYLCLEQVAWHLDKTNESDDYTRNRIRHHVLSYAEENICAGAVSHMAKTAEMLAETEEYLEEGVQAAGQQAVLYREEQKIVLSVPVCRQQAKVIISRLLLSLLKEISPSGQNIGMVHVKAVEDLIHRTGNASVCLPYGIRAVRQYDEVILDRSEKKGEEQNRFIFHIFSVTDPEKKQDFPKNQYTKWFDYDKIDGSLEIRTRQTGDYLTIRGAKDGLEVHKTVKDYMIGEKIPASLRDRMPLLAAGHHIIWIPGWRISEHFKVSSDTLKILEVTWIPE